MAELEQAHRIQLPPTPSGASDDIQIVSVEDALASTTNSELKSKLKELEETLDTVEAHFETQTAQATVLLQKMRTEHCNFPGLMKDRNVVNLTSSLSYRTPIWQRDHDASNCKMCRKEFKKIFRKRHHCRSCGYVFCGKCSNHFMPLPEFGYYENVRVCLNCYRVSHQVAL